METKSQLELAYLLKQFLNKSGGVSPFLTVRQAASILEVSVGSVRYYERTRKLTAAFKLETGERLFFFHDVDFLARRRAGAKKHQRPA